MSSRARRRRTGCRGARASDAHRYTRRSVKATVEPLEGNKVKLSVEVDEHEFERAVDAAFKKIAHEVRIPGFRPGQGAPPAAGVPTRVLCGPGPGSERRSAGVLLRRRAHQRGRRHRPAGDRGHRWRGRRPGAVRGGGRGAAHHRDIRLRRSHGGDPEPVGQRRRDRRPRSSGSAASSPSSRWWSGRPRTAITSPSTSRAASTARSSRAWWPAPTSTRLVRRASCPSSTKSCAARRPVTSSTSRPCTPTPPRRAPTERPKTQTQTQTTATATPVRSTSRWPSPR